MSSVHVREIISTKFQKADIHKKFHLRNIRYTCRKTGILYLQAANAQYITCFY